jgi:hypothetical protein
MHDTKVVGGGAASFVVPTPTHAVIAYTVPAAQACGLEHAPRALRRLRTARLGVGEIRHWAGRRQLQLPLTAPANRSRCSPGKTTVYWGQLRQEDPDPDGNGSVNSPIQVAGRLVWVSTIVGDRSWAAIFNDRKPCHYLLHGFGAGSQRQPSDGNTQHVAAQTLAFGYNVIHRRIQWGRPSANYRRLNNCSLPLTSPRPPLVA